MHMPEQKKRKLQGSPHASSNVRRAELLQAAMVAFGESGYHKTTIDAIAQKANLSKGSVYRFFDSKDDVLLAILNLFEKEITEEIERELTTCQNIIDSIEISQKLTLNYVIKRKGLLSVWPDFYRHPEGKARIQEMFENSRVEYTNALNQAIKNGEIPAQPIESIVTSLMAINEGFLILTEVSENFDFEHHIKGVWGVLKQGFLNPLTPKKERGA